MRFRWATATDRHELARVWQRAWHKAHAAIVDCPRALAQCNVESFDRRLVLFERNHERYEELHIRPTALVVEERSSRILGFAIIRHGNALEQFYIDNDVQGTGVGTKLLAATEATMLKQGCEVAHLIVAMRNARANRFYERRGWLVTGSQPWMHEETPWYPYHEPSVDGRRAEEMATDRLATDAPSMRCTRYKKFLGYD